MIGEIGGPQEVAAGEFAKENMKKPIIGYIQRHHLAQQKH